MDHAADDRDIPILGAAILRLSGTSSKGEAVSTRQIVYITKHTDKIFLSREACADLGIIPNQFNKTTGPSQGDAANTTQQAAQKGSLPKKDTGRGKFEYYYCAYFFHKFCELIFCSLQVI